MPMIQKIKLHFRSTKEAPRSTGSVARFLREASSEDQKKVFFSAIDGAMEKQRDTIRKAEALKS